jgi:hypothetical protein
MYIVSVHMCNESYSHSYRLPARHPSPYKACIFENPNIYAESDLMYVIVVVFQYEPNIVKGPEERESFLVHSVSSYWIEHTQKFFEFVLF